MLKILAQLRKSIKTKSIEILVYCSASPVSTS